MNKILFPVLIALIIKNIINEIKAMIAEYLEKTDNLIDNNLFLSILFSYTKAFK